MNNDAAVVLFSGGQDSTTCLYWAKATFKKVYALCFYYEQKHVGEVEVARNLAKEAGVEFHEIDISFMAKLTRNALTDPSIPMDEKKPEGALPNSFVPGRNMFFLTVAAVFARERGINNLVTGVSQTDFSGYPDCRYTFVNSLSVTLNLALEKQFIIHTPLMWSDKSETWALAEILGVFDIVRDQTLTCYNGVPGDGCGKCPACELRKKGLEKYLKLRGKS